MKKNTRRLQITAIVIVLVTVFSITYFGRTNASSADKSVKTKISAVEKTKPLKDSELTELFVTPIMSLTEEPKTTQPKTTEEHTTEVKTTKEQTTEPQTTKEHTTEPKTTKEHTTEVKTTKEPTTCEPTTEEPLTNAAIIEEEPVYTEPEEQFVEPEEVEEEVVNKSDDNYLVYDLTAYWTAENGHSTKSGRYATEGRTVACNSLPLYTRIYIEGFGEYIVEDTGGMEDYKIDIFFEDPHPNFYRHDVRVWIIG